MLTRITMCVLLLLAVTAAGAQKEIESPFFLPTPEGWSTEVNLASSTTRSGSWLGTVLAYDAFVTRRPVELGVRIDTIRCPSQGRLALFFQLSPQPAEHEIWRGLGELRDGFRCDHAPR